MSIHAHLQIVGALLLLLGLANGWFPRYFGWTKETTGLSLFTRQVFLVHCFFIGLTLVLMGALSWTEADALLLPGPLSRAVLAGMMVFWLLRLLFQLFVYKAAIWRGQPFYTVMHVLFTMLWTYVAATYGVALHAVWRS